MQSYCHLLRISEYFTRCNKLTRGFTLKHIGYGKGIDFVAVSLRHDPLRHSFFVGRKARNNCELLSVYSSNELPV